MEQDHHHQSDNNNCVMFKVKSRNSIIGKDKSSSRTLVTSFIRDSCHNLDLTWYSQPVISGVYQAQHCGHYFTFLREGANTLEGCLISRILLMILSRDHLTAFLRTMLQYLQYSVCRWSDSNKYSSQSQTGSQRP